MYTDKNQRNRGKNYADKRRRKNIVKTSNLKNSNKKDDHSSIIKKANNI